MLLMRTLCVALALACLEAHAQATRKPYESSGREPRERPERDYVPKTYTHRNPPKPSRPSSAPLKSTHIQPKQEQPKHSWTQAPARDPDLARCDDLRRRYENAMRRESASAAERKAIYQKQVRSGC